MTDKQLEKLIKQGGIVGNIDEHIAIKLDPNIHEIFYPYDGSSECLYEKDLTLGKSVYKCRVFDLEKISKKYFDKITWYNKTHAEHTERFEPPMWEDMQKILQQEPYYNFVFVKNNSIYEFVVSDKLGVRNYNCIDLDKCLFFGNSTKENYIKACEIVRDLFNKGSAK